MGMFDNIFCEVELPDGFDHAKHSFQTKDLDCVMDDYTITKEGRLMLTRYSREEIPASERKGLFPLFRTVKEDQEDTVFHGKFNFYTSDENDVWHEYVAFFSYGKLDSIKVFNPTDVFKKSRTE